MVTPPEQSIKSHEDLLKMLLYREKGSNIELAWRAIPKDRLTEDYKRELRGLLDD